MKKILMGFFAVLFVAVGLSKIADLFDISIKKNAVESERSIAANGWPKEPRGEKNSSSIKS